MESILIHPSPLKGTVKVPVSKSEAQRALLISAALGTPRNPAGLVPPYCRDLLSTFQGADLLIKGASSPAPLSADLGASAAVLRMLVPLLWAKGISADLTISQSLSQRPHRELEALAKQAGTFLSVEGQHIAVGGQLRPGTYRVDCSQSSQFASGMLMALCVLGKESVLHPEGPIVSPGYLQLTLWMLRKAGYTIEVQDDSYFILPSAEAVPPKALSLYGDWSQAGILLCANALGAEISVSGLQKDSLQPDRDVLSFLEGMGMKAGFEGETAVCTLSHRLAPLQLDGSGHPDLLPFLALAASKAAGETRITGVGRLRGKESDRLSQTLQLFAKLDLPAFYQPGEDCLCIRGNPHSILRGGFDFDPREDHRMAMLCAMAAAFCDAPVRLWNPDCVKKSWPTFWQDYESIGGVLS